MIKNKHLFYLNFSMVSNKCVVKGCLNSDKRKYLFPINDLDFAMWVERTANPLLHSLSKEKIRKTYQICGKYFETICISPGTNNKLKYRSLSTLNLPRNILSLMYVLHVYVQCCINIIWQKYVYIYI